jgi:cysteine desulfurase
MRIPQRSFYQWRYREQQYRYLAAVRDLGCKHIISSVIEHHATTHTVEYLYHTGEASLSYVKLLPNGHIDLEDLEKLLAESEEKCLVTLMHANNEIGNMLDIHSVGELCKLYNAIFIAILFRPLAIFLLT